MSSFVKKINQLKSGYSASEYRFLIPVSLFILVCIIVAVSFSFYGQTEVELRSLAPKDTIIYLETNNLGNTLNALTESKSFKENSNAKTDFSPINGLQVAIAINGFETSENQVTNEQSILNFKPTFTAIAETNAWTWQVTSLVENNLNSFVKKTYGNDAKFEKKSVNNTKKFTWTAIDGRKTFAVISGSQVFFGNNEEAINKCLAAKRGEAESLLKNEKLSAEYEKAKGKLAFGFISQEGIKQIADLVGISVAVGQSEDGNARSFISRVLPQILNNTTREITWTAENIDNGIEDRIYIKTENETSKVLSETIVSATSKQESDAYNFLPLETSSITRYNLKNPQIAFRSLLLVTARNTDAINGKIISAFSNSLLTPYGVSDAENFLRSVESEIITAQIDEDSSIAIVKIKDFEMAKKTINDEINFGGKNDEQIWKSEDESLSVVRVKDILILGDAKSVAKSLAIYNERRLSPLKAEKDFTQSKMFNNLRTSKAAASTLVRNSETAEKIVSVLGKLKENRKPKSAFTFTQTYFNKRGIQRRYISDYGFLGTIIEQFESE